MRLVGASKFVFLHETQKMFSSPENLYANIECPDIHANFFLNFLALKYVLNSGFICTYEPNWISEALHP
jgi:hypothetical protein